MFNLDFKVKMRSTENVERDVQYQVGRELRKKFEEVYETKGQIPSREYTAPSNHAKLDSGLNLYLSPETGISDYTHLFVHVRGRGNGLENTKMHSYINEIFKVVDFAEELFESNQRVEVKISRCTPSVETINLDPDATEIAREKSFDEFNENVGYLDSSLKNAMKGKGFELQIPTKATFEIYSNLKQRSTSASYVFIKEYDQGPEDVLEVHDALVKEIYGLPDSLEKVR